MAVSSLDDMVRLLQALMPGGPTLLKAETLADMARNHLPPGLHVRFPGLPANPRRVFGLGSSVLAQPRRPAHRRRRRSTGAAPARHLVVQPAPQHRRRADDPALHGHRRPLRRRVQALAYQALGLTAAQRSAASRSP